MKKYLLIGCSNGCDLHTYFQLVFGSPKIQWINLSMAAFGNRYITARLFEYVDEIGIPDYVYLQYSGLSRIDIPLDLKIDVPDYYYQQKTNKRNWVASGGRNGRWRTCDMLKRFFAYMYDPESDTCEYDLSLHEIFKGIELCKTLKIPYNWSSYYDYLNPPNEKTRRDGALKFMPEYIDMTNHIGDFPLNVAYELNRIPDDTIHFDRESAIEFLKRNKNKFNI